MTALWIGAAVFFGPSLLIGGGLVVHYLVERRRKRRTLNFDIQAINATASALDGVAAALDAEQRRGRHLKLAALHSNLVRHPLVVGVKYGDDFALWAHELEQEEESDA